MGGSHGGRGTTIIITVTTAFSFRPLGVENFELSDICVVALRDGEKKTHDLKVL